MHSDSLPANLLNHKKAYMQQFSEELCAESTPGPKAWYVSPKIS